MYIYKEKNIYIVSVIVTTKHFIYAHYQACTNNARNVRLYTFVILLQYIILII